MEKKIGLYNDKKTKNQKRIYNLKFPLKIHEEYLNNNLYPKLKKDPGKIGLNTIDFAMTSMSEFRITSLKKFFMKDYHSMEILNIDF
mmetsp:Transcript_4678/g.3935  ORF Transcript_4678/g.3935 Transcript_4678/m.3935 type:complete len:87 (+) Transcript_4678:157-417(+)